MKAILFLVSSVIFLSNSCMTSHSSKIVQVAQGGNLVLPCENLIVNKIGHNSVVLISENRIPNPILNVSNKNGLSIGCRTIIKLVKINGDTILIEVTKLHGGYMFP